MTELIVITGAAGRIGTLLRPRMARPGRILRLVDIAPQPAPAPGEAVETVHGDITDLPAMEAACAGADAVIHLGGLSTEGPWEDVLRLNVHGTRQVFEAARRAKVPRVVFASTNHVVGFHPRAAGDPGDHALPRPDTHYGVSKAAGEALGSLYHDRYGLDVLCVRIGACFPRPLDAHMLQTWLSPDDCARLMEALLTAPSPGFRVVWGVSDNTRRWWSLKEARALGYDPRDDAETHAPEIPAARGGGPDPTRPPHDRLGGSFCDPSLDVDRPGRHTAPDRTRPGQSPR
ncbi:NAD(P)-dependent oxidoreductase [Nocardiopsis sp. N85]|uniref:NAD-dependent epimerase/dehydratase family protein n=1 Tax=Nocardiopsis sp. N85 TaxID=3029400 RepID=UPI00237F830D|nr:NAD(P)-dependent oxidoreductase [Nocardiopsis sp. N85]MDE3722201.1 NAD(P)-dependent oxidoreductase [Nocardiopsis sp. N85]